jgi:hypothetical protein
MFFVVFFSADSRAETMLAMTAEGHILLSCEPLIEPSWGDEGMGGGLVGRWWLAGVGGGGPNFQPATVEVMLAATWTN